VQAALSKQKNADPPAHASSADDEMWLGGDHLSFELAAAGDDEAMLAGSAVAECAVDAEAAAAAAPSHELATGELHSQIRPHWATLRCRSGPIFCGAVACSDGWACWTPKRSRSSWARCRHSRTPCAAVPEEAPDELQKVSGAAADAKASTPAVGSKGSKASRKRSGTTVAAKDVGVSAAGTVAVPQRVESLEPGPQATFGGSKLLAAQAMEHQKVGQLAHAAAKLREAIFMEADPMYSLQHCLNLGHIFNNLGDRARGAQVLNEMLSRAAKLRRKLPRDLRPRLDYLEAIGHVNLGSVLEDDRLIRVHLEKAMHLNPDCPGVLSSMANLLEREGKYDEAIESANKLLAHQAWTREDIPALGIKVRCYELLNRHFEAVKNFIEICRLDTASTYVALKQIWHSRAKDVFICTFPRCGTTWMVQVAVCILFGVEAEYNDKAVFVEGVLATDPNLIWRIEKMRDPRVLKMHSPVDVFPGLEHASTSELQAHGKIIYIVRNPKDALLSLRQHHANNKSIEWNGSNDRWVDDWIAGKRSEEYGGSYFEHVKTWWNLHRRYPERVKVIYFEDMKADLASVVLDVAEFLGVEALPDSVDKIVERCSFDQMKSRHKVDDDIKDKVNPMHFYKGEVSRWRHELTAEQARRVDEATWKHLRQEVEEGLKIHDLEPI